MTRQFDALVLGGAIALAFSPMAAGTSPETGLSLTPEQMNWEPNPRVPGLGVARIIGSGGDSGPYVYRVKFPKGRVVQAHSHPDDRLYTVISGTWYIGWGTTYDESKLTALPAGSFYTEPAGAPHFVATLSRPSAMSHWRWSTTWPRSGRRDEDLDAWFDRRFERKMAELESSKQPSMTIIATKGTLDMAYPPFILASTAAALGWGCPSFSPSTASAC